jgi:hypothetical protein
VSIVGKTYYLTLSLISVKTGKIENVAEDTCRCEIDELLGSTKRLAKKLIGEQGVPPGATAPEPATIAEAKTEAIAKAKAEEIEKAKAEQIAKAKAEEIARAKAKADAIAKAEEIERAKAAQMAKAKAEAEEIARAKAQSEAIAKAKAEEIEKAKAAQIAKEKVEAEATARAKAKADAVAKAEETERAKAAQAAKAKAEAEERGRVEAAAKAKADAIAKAEAMAKAEEIAKAKAKQHESKATTAAIDPAGASAKIVASGGSFENLASGVVRDTKSGLEWYAGPDKNTGWDDAKTWVANLNVDGGGWRMPTISELKGLYRKGTGARNMTPLLESTGWWVWSGDTTGSGLPITGVFGAWALDFDDSSESWCNRSDSSYKRAFAVRSTPEAATAVIYPGVVIPQIVISDGRFEKLASGVVRDTKSGLEWYAGPDKNTGWDDAKGWAAGLRVDGGGWRMPTITELKGLYKKGAGSRNMTSLLETTGWWVWSGETAHPPGGSGFTGGGGSWALDFDNGVELLDKRDNSHYKRGFAVRSRK